MKTNKHLNDKGQLIVRCSSLGSVMASPNSDKLSVGAKSFVKNAFKETYLEYEESINTIQMSKGKIMEDEAIRLISLMYEEPYIKNEDNLSNGFIKGTCDVHYMNKIRDTKCPFSKKTHPLLPEDGEDSGYEWQGRGYMWLWNKDEFYLDYVLVDTPEDLIPKWEPMSIHRVEHLSLQFRITTIKYERCLIKEQQIKQRIEGMRIYWNELKKYFKIK